MSWYSRIDWCLKSGWVGSVLLLSSVRVGVGVKSVERMRRDALTQPEPNPNPKPNPKPRSLLPFAFTVAAFRGKRGKGPNTKQKRGEEVRTQSKRRRSHRNSGRRELYQMLLFFFLSSSCSSSIRFGSRLRLSVLNTASN